MGSTYQGEVNFGGERGSGSSSRKGKKNNSYKPKQPQRGLGVAQLEKIRLHGQMTYSHNPSFQTHFSSSYNTEDMGMQSAYSSLSSSSFPYSTTSSSSSSSSSFPYSNIIMGHGEYNQRANHRYEDSQPTTAGRWIPSGGITEAQHFVHPNMSFFNPHEDLMHKNSKRRYKNDKKVGSSSDIDEEEMDLELRLSL